MVKEILASDYLAAWVEQEGALCKLCALDILSVIAGVVVTLAISAEIWPKQDHQWVPLA